MSMILNPYRYAAAGSTFGNASRDFDSASSQYIDLPISHGSLVGSGNGITLAAWVKTPSPATRQIVIGDWNNSATNESAALDITNSKATFYARPAGALKSVGTSGSLGADTWHHIAGFYDYGVGVGASIDGTVTTGPSASGDLGVGADSSIGRAGAYDGLYMDGLIADVRIYDRALSGSELSDLASGTDVSSGLIGWWLRNTDDVLDYAGSNHGTNNGSTYSTDGPFD